MEPEGRGQRHQVVHRLVTNAIRKSPPLSRLMRDGPGAWDLEPGLDSPYQNSPSSLFATPSAFGVTSLSIKRSHPSSQPPRWLSCLRNCCLGKQQKEPSPHASSMGNLSRDSTRTQSQSWEAFIA